MQEDVCNLSLDLDMQDVTRYLFLHGHILNQQSADSMRAFPGFPPWTKSWSARSQTSQTDTVCCCQPLGHQRKRWNFLSPIYDQSPWSTHVTATPPLITHKAELLSIPPPPGIHQNWLLSSSEECDSYLSSTPLPCNLQYGKSGLRPDLDS